ncbi:TPA: transposase [Clostridium botulinum]|nr:transposase [Clostridium botulinum]NFB60219.1 transposase [Clostridium botulinum]HCL4446662.1 transposase [Clostridium botulinum]HCL4458124.1 transposase [Clostridium botulinum]HCL4461831.1 transposase [Clostridium botulinum]
MKKSKKRNYIKDIGKIIINKVRINIKGYISSIIISLVNTWVNKLVSSRNSIFGRPSNSIFGRPSNSIAKSTDIYFLILSAMILFTYYYLHKH